MDAASDDIITEALVPQTTEPSPTADSCTTCSTINSSQITVTYPVAVQEYSETICAGNSSNYSDSNDNFTAIKSGVFATC